MGLYEADRLYLAAQRVVLDSLFLHVDFSLMRNAHNAFDSWHGTARQEGASSPSVTIVDAGNCVFGQEHCFFNRRGAVAISRS